METVPSAVCHNRVEAIAKMGLIVGNNRVNNVMSLFLLCRCHGLGQCLLPSISRPQEELVLRKF